ncbi:secreted RxLR effector protein 161-like [Solanum verrucosum]|uniref:secreted RxLR effector protein 161-like n=1 Tax=Solanum verrucosum TaxID=315347 RepID=UPI0020D04DDC|nr:secreted RxLR effector protein 161-like [Solanum verrucosum]
MHDRKPVRTVISIGVKLGKDADSEKVDDSMYRRLIGSLLYLTTSRPDILFVVSLLSRLIHSSRDTHFTTTKRVLRYIKRTNKFGTFFLVSVELTMNMVEYSNSDWGGRVDNSKSTYGYLFCVGTSCFIWSFRKQETTTKSTVETEYIVAPSTMNQAIEVWKMLKDLSHEQTEASKITCDYNSKVSISRNPVFHG